MNPYLNIDDFKYHIQQQAEKIRESLLPKHSLKKVDLDKAIALYYAADDLLSFLPIGDLIETINDAIFDTVRTQEEDETQFKCTNSYINSRVWNLTMISNFIAQAAS
ncbi:hypothetical protein ABDK00_006725 [Niabella insulamsoli]|uniref:hypothetical protein n=1 Tax=Niabella insulamsoli TaxID=3144874 RepID=UPI0031FC674D